MEAIIKYNTRTHLLVLADKTWQQEQWQQLQQTQQQPQQQQQQQQQNFIDRFTYFKLDTITNVQIEFG